MRILCILHFAACTTASTHIRRIYMRYALSGNFPILKISSATIYVNTKNNLCMKGCKFLQTRTRTTTIWAAKKSSKNVLMPDTAFVIVMHMLDMMHMLHMLLMLPSVFHVLRICIYMLHMCMYLTYKT